MSKLQCTMCLMEAMECCHSRSYSPIPCWKGKENICNIPLEYVAYSDVTCVSAFLLWGECDAGKLGSLQQITAKGRPAPSWTTSTFVKSSFHYLRQRAKADVAGSATWLQLRESRVWSVDKEERYVWGKHLFQLWKSALAYGVEHLKMDCNGRWKLYQWMTKLHSVRRQW